MRKCIFLAIIVFGVFFFAKNSWADTHTAASCSAVDITTAIVAASSGDTVAVPSGSCSWSAGVNLNKSTILQGNGIGSTIITGGDITLSATNARITGFTFNSTGIEISASSGLIDSNTFNVSGSGAEVIHVYGPDNSWSTDSSYGTANAVYIENNTFATTQGLGSTQCVQGNYNARFVFRFNTVTNMKVDAHGIWSNGSPSHYCDWNYPNIHSARHYEIYGNHFRVYPNDGSQYYWFSMELRGGSGIIFNNEFTGSSRYNGSGYPRTYFHEYCCAVGYDGNCCSGCVCPNEYPSRDQLGRGKNQTLEPLYVWDYLVNGVWSETTREDWPASNCISECGFYTADDIVKKNRDYYEYTSSFDGAAGVGVGTFVNRPATCTTGVAYWATDQGGDWNTANGTLNDGFLYKCASTNRWVAFYTPYTYPHPLRSGDFSTPTSTPSPTSTPIPTPAAKRGDLNNDTYVDVIDLGILLSNWNSTSRPPSDINQDGWVDVIDLGILLSNWG